MSPRSADGRLTSYAASDGIVMLFAGHGWGKTAAAIGYAMRARGLGWPTTVVQFLKGGGWNVPEIASADHLDIGWPVLSSRMTWAPGDLQELTAIAWRHVTTALLAPGPSLVVLDELTHVVDDGLLDIADVVKAVDARARATSVIVTGRTMPPELVELADTVTAFERVKHGGKKGILGS